MESLGGPLGVLGSHLGLTWGSPGGPLGSLGGHLGVTWGHLGVRWAFLRAKCSPFKVSLLFLESAIAFVQVFLLFS